MNTVKCILYNYFSLRQMIRISCAHAQFIKTEKFIKTELVFHSHFPLFSSDTSDTQIHISKA